MPWRKCWARRNAIVDASERGCALCGEEVGDSCDCATQERAAQLVRRRRARGRMRVRIPTFYGLLPPVVAGVRRSDLAVEFAAAFVLRGCMTSWWTCHGTLSFAETPAR